MLGQCYRLRIDADLPRDALPPPAEFARQVRDLVDRGLRTPGLMISDSGATWRVPPIDSRFQLGRVLLRTHTVPPQIHILFRWDGEQTLYGVRVSVEQDDYEPVVIGTTVAGSLASLITISLEEDLLAHGYGIENAIRKPQGDVTWLHWNSKWPGQ